ncbi:MAG: lipopolysaccharide heptosyltransferase II [FCB group bacterium]|nr:lipopolysaccharide heptosyltransferase II [FCB group bacterium]
MSPKLLIRAPNHLGDCVMALPMINEAREAYPGAHITVLVPQNLAELFNPNPAIDNVIGLPKEHVHGLIGVMKIKDLIAPYHFDIGYILPPSFGSAAGFKLAGVKKRIGYISDGRRLLLTKPLALPSPLNETHRSKLYFDLLRRGANVELEFVRPKLFLNDDDIEKGNRLLDDFGLNPTEEYIVIAFQAVAESRRWGISNYINLIKHIIADYGFKIILSGTEEDKNAGDEISEGTGAKQIRNLAGKTSIRELAAVLSQAKFFVGNDSGAAHLAAAVGTPLVVLSGADNPQSTSPIAAQKKLIYLQNLDCISCVKNKCPLKGQKYMQCMTGISVDMVMAEIDTLIKTIN